MIWEKSFLDFVVNTENLKFKKLKIPYTFEKPLVISIICSKCENEDEKTFKE